MFASEKVMKNYLDQLLNEDITEDEIFSEPANKALVADQTAQDSVYSAKTKEKFNQRQAQEEPQLQLKPIEKAIVADKKRPVREAEVPEINSLEMLLQQVSIQQKEAEAAEIMKQQLADKVEPKQDIETTLKSYTETQVKAKTEVKAKTKQITKPEVTTVVEPEAEVQAEPEVYNPEVDIINEPFQALFFDVAGLVLAVPLQELGGIHNLEEVTNLFGKPDWFMGVMVNRDKKVNVVETARWVMPEKYTEKLKAELSYKYLIMLGESSWGLAAEKLVTTEYIQPDEVKWRSQQGKRPWLLGTIKKKMCALLHVSDLVAMLDKGIDARQV